MYQFKLGDRIEPSAEGLRTFRRWGGREGTIIGRSRDEDVWEVRWDGRAKVERIHASFIVVVSHQDPLIEIYRTNRARA